MLDQNNFTKALTFTLKYEGGWVDDKDDPGGKTNYGISDAGDGTIDGLIDLDRDGSGDVPVADLTREQAIKIYYDHYWLKSGCKDLPLPIAVCVFDTAVNCGVGRAKYFLKNCRDTNDYVARRINFYSKLITSNPKLTKFYKGWINRVVDLRKYADILAKELTP